LLHLSGYIGVPVIREAMIAASKIFAEYRAETAAEQPNGGLKSRAESGNGDENDPHR